MRLNNARTTNASRGTCTCDGFGNNLKAIAIGLYIIIDIPLLEFGIIVNNRLIVLNIVKMEDEFNSAYFKGFANH